MHCSLEELALELEQLMAALALSHNLHPTTESAVPTEYCSLTTLHSDQAQDTTILAMPLVDSLDSWLGSIVQQTVHLWAWRMLADPAQYVQWSERSRQHLPPTSEP